MNIQQQFKRNAGIRTYGVCAALGLMTSVLVGAPAIAGDAFELVPHNSYVSGVEYIDTGNYARAVKKLESSLRGNTQANATRTPILIDLCVGYTMLRDFSKASEYCEASVELGWSRGIAFNNRGVMKAARGDYEGAQRDFQASVDGRGADNIARRNLELTQTRLIAMRSKDSTPENFDGELVASNQKSSQQ